MVSPRDQFLGRCSLLLVLKYIPDVVNCLCKLFADDTKLISTIKNQLDLFTLQHDLNNLVEWSENWLMSFNDEKCKVMVTNNKHLDFNLSVNGNQLEWTYMERDLKI